MSPPTRTSATGFAAVVVTLLLAAPLPGAAVELGPPREANLSREKLSAIDDFLNRNLGGIGRDTNTQNP